MLKFAANLNFMFAQEASSVVDRISLAAAAGFKAVEIPDPYEIDPSALVLAKENSSVEVVLINSWPGDFADGEYGVAIFPDRCKEFREKLDLSITYLKVLVLRCLYNFQPTVLKQQLSLWYGYHPSVSSVGTNLIHNFTAVTFSVKFTSFREKR